MSETLRNAFTYALFLRASARASAKEVNKLRCTRAEAEAVARVFYSANAVEGLDFGRGDKRKRSAGRS